MDKEEGFEEGPELEMIGRDRTGKLVVNLRQKLKTDEEMEKFVAELNEAVTREEANGKACTFEDFDISQNMLPLEQIEGIFSCLADGKAHVERFRGFGIPTFDDQACTLLAAWISTVDKENAPMEMHLSDCAITDEGFQALMSALETSDAYPCPDPRYPQRMVPLMLRVEHNYIDEEFIKAKVDEGIIVPFKKMEHRSADGEAKAKVLVREDGTFQQKQGPPPAPEDAPPPKPVREKGKTKGIDFKGAGGKGKDSKGGPPWRSEGKGKGKGKDRDRGYSSHQALPDVRRTIEKPSYSSGKGRGRDSYDYNRSGGYNRSDGYDRSGYNRPSSNRDYDRPRVFTPRESGGRAAANGRHERPKEREPPSGKGKGRSKLPYPWEEHWSEEYGLNYFWNSKSGDSSWERPRA